MSTKLGGERPVNVLLAQIEFRKQTCVAGWICTLFMTFASGTQFAYMHASRLLIKTTTLTAFRALPVIRSDSRYKSLSKSTPEPGVEKKYYFPAVNYGRNNKKPSNN
ncbi:hypothetical protein AFLA_011080 [Aspergillus flavus NRRL3357]|nr:hypothetical protein AFLA_011080 [Aspergillus flavus NRRL3357]